MGLTEPTNRTDTLETLDLELAIPTKTTGNLKNDDDNFVTSLLTNDEWLVGLHLN
jgi:hypothetical protein